MTAPVLTRRHAKPHEVEVRLFRKALQKRREPIVRLAVAPLFHQQLGAAERQAVEVGFFDGGELVAQSREPSPRCVRALVTRELVVERLECVDGFGVSAQLGKKFRDLVERLAAHGLIAAFGRGQELQDRSFSFPARTQ